MSFNAIRDNKILVKISEITVVWLIVLNPCQTEYFYVLHSQV